MNPAANATASGGIAGAFVTIIAWVFSLAHVVLPTAVQTALAVLATAAIGYFLHRRSLPPVPPAPQP